MNLSWIAAVLAPHDIASRPNVPEDDHDFRETAGLADLVLGRARAGKESPSSPLLDAARRSLIDKTVRDAVPELAALLREPSGDPARSAAYTLVLCNAAAELDDYDTCLNALDLALVALSDGAADAALVRAAVMQQKALRLRDAGLPHLSASKDAASALLSADTARCTPFRTAPNTGRTDKDVIETIKGNLRGAIGSLITFAEADRMEMPVLREWRAQDQRLGTELIRRTTQERAREYSEYLRKVFRSDFDRRTRTVVGHSHPDLFAANLSYELAGHGSVYPTRQELALLRLVQRNEHDANLADAVRLLRHSTASKELTYVLEKLLDGGPLSAVAEDARQILATRTASHLLRAMELQVLDKAADLLTEAEATRGLDAVLTALAAGGPFDLPGKWQLPVLRHSAAWSAAAGLANVCGRTSEVAALLLTEAHQAGEDDQTLESELWRALRRLEWDTISEDVRREWLAARAVLADRLPGVTTLVSQRAGVRIPPAGTDSPLELLANEIDHTRTGGQADPAVIASGIAAVRERMSHIRASAAAHRHEFGGSDAADIGAAAVADGLSPELWPDLVAFLLDPLVSRDDTTAAFDRLARADITLPDDVAASFASGIRRIILSTSGIFFAPSLVPYPAALRFAAVHGLLTESETYELTARLLGGADAGSRREGALTVALLGRKRPTAGLLPMVLPFAEDENVEVRATAGLALVQLARLDGPLRGLAVQRIVDLLDADGTLIPTALLNALADAPELLDPDASPYYQLIPLMDHHPARSVRRKARTLLNP